MKWLLMPVHVLCIFWSVYLKTQYTYGGFHFESGSLKITLLEELACYQMDNLKNEEFNEDNSRKKVWKNTFEEI